MQIKRNRILLLGSALTILSFLAGLFHSFVPTLVMGILVAPIALVLIALAIFVPILICGGVGIYTVSQNPMVAFFVLVSFLLIFLSFKKERA